MLRPLELYGNQRVTRTGPDDRRNSYDRCVSRLINRIDRPRDKEVSRLAAWLAHELTRDRARATTAVKNGVNVTGKSTKNEG